MRLNHELGRGLKGRDNQKTNENNSNVEPDRSAPGLFVRPTAPVSREAAPRADIF
jgi:hypothetical protein